MKRQIKTINISNYNRKVKNNWEVSQNDDLDLNTLNRKARRAKKKEARESDMLVPKYQVRRIAEKIKILEKNWSRCLKTGVKTMTPQKEEKQLEIFLNEVCKLAQGTLCIKRIWVEVSVDYLDGRPGIVLVIDAEDGEYIISSVMTELLNNSFLSVSLMFKSQSKGYLIYKINN